MSKLDESFKFDGEKPRVDLIPSLGLLEIGKVLAFGAKKYSAWSWTKVESFRYVGAALRHIYAATAGEKIDPESGLPHLAQAATNILFLLERELSEDYGKSLSQELVDRKKD